MDVSNTDARNSVVRIAIVASPVKLRFNAENDVAELVVEPDLTSTDEHAVVTRVMEDQAEKVIGHVTLVPSATDVAAYVETSPTERRRHIGRRAYANISGIRGHGECKQRRYGGDGMQ